MLATTFLSGTDEALSQEFLTKGYIIRPVDDRTMLDAMRTEIVKIVCNDMQISIPKDASDFLNHFEKICPVEKLNGVRLATYHAMNDAPWFRPTYFALARSIIETLVGNELAMQNRVNLSIQLPDDDSSLLPIHADAFGGETPYQVVQWMPLVDCYGSKTMFILPRPKCEAAYKKLASYEGKGMDHLMEDVKDDLVWCEVPYGHMLVFSPNNLHGGAINREKETRWSMNARYTGLFTPYTGAEKKLGSYYLPITTRAATKAGIAYREPSGFKE